MNAGVVALQGSFAPHRAMFERLGVAAREVRMASDLENLSHLVIPGGESTTLHHLFELFGLGDAIRQRFRDGQLSLFGTCAGAILIGRDLTGSGLTGSHDPPRPPRLGLLDAVVERNAYGRQVDSDVRPLQAPSLGGDLKGVFIRAPRFHHLGPAVEVLARDGDEPVLLAEGKILAATFHPELTEDPRVHENFLQR